MHTIGSDLGGASKMQLLLVAFVSLLNLIFLCRQAIITFIDGEYDWPFFLYLTEQSPLIMMVINGITLLLIILGLVWVVRYTGLMIATMAFFQTLITAVLNLGYAFQIYREES